MPDRREQLIHVFEDTQRFYLENETLSKAVSYGRVHTKLYEADDYPELPAVGTPEQLGEIADDADGSLGGQSAAMQKIQKIEEGASYIPAGRLAKIRLSKRRTFRSAIKLHEEFPDKKIAVLNFASATRPGGGVTMGSSAQEESLCRCSTLFPTIDRRWLYEQYYTVNRNADDFRNTDAVIYSPGVIICKTDEDIPQRMDERDFVTVDVISCAAPDLRGRPKKWTNYESDRDLGMPPAELLELQKKRISHILHIAALHQVDILVLGAFGCGAFENDPNIIARAFKMALMEYRNRFDVIEFAIYCRDHETENYQEFYNEFSWEADGGAKYPDYNFRQENGTDTENENSQETEFVFFWKEDEAHGYLSQWSWAWMFIEGIQYSCCEQYMMAKKALAMRDLESYVLIMNETDPQKIKHLGRRVRDFDSTLWDRCVQDVIYNANKAKFSQNAGIRASLLATGNAILAEASPFDTIYGIGLDAKDPDAKRVDKWKGKNLLGETLMRVRREIREEFGSGSRCF